MPDMLSQDEIDALLGEDKKSDAPKSLSNKEKDDVSKLLDKVMQKSSEVLSNLINKGVNIKFDSGDDESMLSDFVGSQNYIGVSYKYSHGLKGINVILVKEDDAKAVANLMMGSEEVKKDEEFSDLHLSAFTEAVSQMIGSSSTTLSALLNDKIDITPPKSDKITNMSDLDNIISTSDGLFVVTYNFIIDDFVTSDFYFLIPNSIITQILDKLNGNTQEPNKKEEIKETKQEPIKNEVVNNEVQANNNMDSNVNVKPVQFADIHSSITQKQKENIDLIMDVPLEVTVELGRTHKSIKEILEFAPGTIIELDKLAGEPIDILVNGKFVAKGEVIVIDENFGIRITEIIDVKDRL